MTVPSPITKVHLDASSDDPKQARAELVAAIDAINDIIAHLNSSSILQNALGVGTGLSSGGGNINAAAGTTSAAGALELATDAEAQAGSDTTRAITPANLQAVTATDTRKGVAELATNAEVLTGTDTVRIVTPAGLQAKIDALTPAPTAASTGEVSGETATDEFIRPDRLRYAPSVAKNWGNVDWRTSGSVYTTLIRGYNISSVSQVSNKLRVSFTNAMGTTSYIVVGVTNSSAIPASGMSKTTGYVDLPDTGAGSANHSEWAIFE